MLSLGLLAGVLVGCATFRVGMMWADHYWPNEHMTSTILMLAALALTGSCLTLLVNELFFNAHKGEALLSMGFLVLIGLCIGALGRL
jgi:hypothetical protein